MLLLLIFFLLIIISFCYFYQIKRKKDTKKIIDKDLEMASASSGYSATTLNMHQNENLRYRHAATDLALPRPHIGKIIPVQCFQDQHQDSIYHGDAPAAISSLALSSALINQNNNESNVYKQKSSFQYFEPVQANMEVNTSLNHLKKHL
jgi:hypothetical protein